MYQVEALRVQSSPGGGELFAAAEKGMHLHPNLPAQWF